MISSNLALVSTILATISTLNLIVFRFRFPPPHITQKNSCTLFFG
uniref:Uncharacterized protein n=1 Tax=Manihot esculenta TaxID=3983 RepID=A0A199U967_MANES